MSTKEIDWVNISNSDWNKEFSKWQANCPEVASKGKYVVTFNKKPFASFKSRGMAEAAKKMYSTWNGRGNQNATVKDAEWDIMVKE